MCLISLSPIFNLDTEFSHFTRMLKKKIWLQHFVLSVDLAENWEKHTTWCLESRQLSCCAFYLHKQKQQTPGKELFEGIQDTWLSVQVCPYWLCDGGLSFKFSGLFSYELLLCKMRNLNDFLRCFHDYRVQGPPSRKSYVFNYFEFPPVLGLMYYPWEWILSRYLEFLFVEKGRNLILV